jgi:hypothetical protein
MNFIATNAPLLHAVDGRQLLFLFWLLCVGIFVISMVMLVLIKGRQWWYRRWVAGIDTRAAAHYHRFMTEASHQHKPPIWRKPDGRP